MYICFDVVLAVVSVREEDDVNKLILLKYNNSNNNKKKKNNTVAHLFQPLRLHQIQTQTNTHTSLLCRIASVCRLVRRDIITCHMMNAPLISGVRFQQLLLLLEVYEVLQHIVTTLAGAIFGLLL
jgi:hypothetical protein